MSWMERRVEAADRQRIQEVYNQALQNVAAGRTADLQHLYSLGSMLAKEADRIDQDHKAALRYSKLREERRKSGKTLDPKQMEDAHRCAVMIGLAREAVNSDFEGTGGHVGPE